MAEEVESDVITENTTEMEEKIEYPLDVKYCGGNIYYFQCFAVERVKFLSKGCLKEFFCSSISSSPP